MAVTIEDSVQVGREGIRSMNRRDEVSGTVRKYRFEFTQGAAAGDAGSKARLVELPFGSVRVILHKSRVWNSAFGAARTLDIGWEAYKDIDNNDVAASDAGLVSGQDVAAAGNFTPGGVIGEDETKLFQSQGGVVLVATVAGGTIPAGARLTGEFEVVNR